MNSANFQLSLVANLNDLAIAEQKAEFAIANAKSFLISGIYGPGNYTVGNYGLKYENQPCISNPYNSACTSNTTCSGSNYFYFAGNNCYDTSDNSNNQFNNMFLNIGYSSIFLDFPVSGTIEPASHVIQAYCSHKGSTTNNNPTVRYLITAQGKGRLAGTFASKKAMFYQSNFRLLNSQVATAPTLTGPSVINVTIGHNVPINGGDPCFTVYKASQTVTMTPMSKAIIYHGNCYAPGSSTITTPTKFDTANIGCRHIYSRANAYCRMDAQGNVQAYAYSPDSGKTNANGACNIQYGNWAAPLATSSVTLYSTVDLNQKTFTCTAQAALPATSIIRSCNNSP